MKRVISSLIVLLCLTACDAQLADAGCDEQCDQLKILARRGDAHAQTELGRMYANGNGVAKDEAQAVSLWQQAAEQNWSKAQFLLGQAYSCGFGGLTPDKEKATELFEKAKQSEG